jgi:hypothetical protein
LRLLSYLILRHDIQNAGTHDSIEDARTALQLYDIYRQLNNEGVWKDELESVYRKGKEMVCVLFNRHSLTTSRREKCLMIGLSLKGVESACRQTPIASSSPSYSTSAFSRYFGNSQTPIINNLIYSEWA